RGGEGGIRTLDTLLTYTHFPGVRLQPLGHLSANLSTRISILATSFPVRCAAGRGGEPGRRRARVNHGGADGNVRQPAASAARPVHKRSIPWRAVSGSSAP